jgi:hypothetical protein
VVGKTAGASQGALSWVAPPNVIAANSVHYDLVSITVTLLLTLFPVKHTNALDRAVVRNRLAESPSTGGLTAWGAV